MAFYDMTENDSKEKDFCDFFFMFLGQLRESAHHAAEDYY